MTQQLRRELDNHAKATGLRLDIIQQDFLLSYLVAGLASQALSRHLIFKGGTALRKCYFKDYRFSEDLDFSALDSAPQGGDLEQQVREWCFSVEKTLNHFAPIHLIVKRYTEKQFHPGEQEAFVIRAQFPWQREPLTRVMIEITREEPLAFAPLSRKIIQDYAGLPSGEIMVYSLEEIFLEKLRAILQHTKKLHERHWTRSRARDYYDLWYLLCHRQIDLRLENPLELFYRKCRPKEVSATKVADFFVPVMLETVRQTWDRWLGRLVSNLPDVDRVLNELSSALSGVLPFPKLGDPSDFKR